MDSYTAASSAPNAHPRRDTDYSSGHKILVRHRYGFFESHIRREMGSLVDFRAGIVAMVVFPRNMTGTKGAVGWGCRRGRGGRGRLSGRIGREGGGRWSRRSKDRRG